MTERKNSSSRNWRGEGAERGRSPSIRRSPSGATKSNFPAEARYWGRVNSQGDFEEAPGFPAPRFQFPWRALGRAARGLVPHISSALVGALSALAFQSLLARPTTTVSQPPPTIIVNPAPVVSAPAPAPAPAPVAAAPQLEPVPVVAPVVAATRPRPTALTRIATPNRPRPIRSTVTPAEPTTKPATVRQSDPDAILEPSF